MNIFLVIGNIINLVQNLPQVIKTYKVKSTKDFSGWFLLLRIISNIIWTAYAIQISSLLMIINNSITIFSTMFISYYKVKELIIEYRPNYNIINNDEEDKENNIGNNEL